MPHRTRPTTNIKRLRKRSASHKLCAHTDPAHAEGRASNMADGVSWADLVRARVRVRVMVRARVRARARARVRARAMARARVR